jgi:hypothetical protein
MKLSFILFFSGLILFPCFVLGQGFEKKLCVIGFERRDFPASLGLQKIFKESEHTRLVIEAGPQDLERCLQEDFDEIILVTHAFFADSDNSRPTLGYFQELKGDERTSFIELNKKIITDRLEELDKSIIHHNTLQKRMEIRRLRKLLSRVAETPQDLALYSSPQIIFSRFFERLSNILRSLQERGELKIKKFRLMTCASDLILNKYPFFQNLSEFGIDLDVAPSSRMASLFKGHQVTNLNRRWLKESLK